MNISFPNPRPFLGLAATVLFATGALGHEYIKCDNGVIANVKTNPIPLRVTSDQFPPGDPFTLALGEVVQGWSNTASAMQFSCVYENPGDGKNAYNNDVNEVYWTKDAQESDQGSDWVGLCIYTMHGAECTMGETDIVFNDILVHFTASKDVDDVPVVFGGGGSTYSFQVVAYHELGHAQALDHTGDVYAVMGAGPHHHVDGSLAISYPGEDAVVGSIGLYGAVPGGMTDLALAPFKYGGMMADYATHDPIALRAAGGGPGVIEDGDVFRVVAGAKVRLEVTVENLGTTGHSTQVAFYLSTDSSITTGDVYLGETGLGVQPNVPITIESPVLELPAFLGIGEDYWLGAVIDPEQVIAETSEWNNRTNVRLAVDLWKPDLRADFVLGPDEIYSGGSNVLVASAYSNVGGPLAGATSYELQLVDPESELPPQFSGITVLTVNGASPEYHLDLMNLPDGFPTGDYVWALKVAQAAGGEGDAVDPEQPNFVLGNEVTVKLGPTELVAAAVFGPASSSGLEVGDDMEVEFTVANLGSTLDHPVIYTVVLSADEDIEQSDWAVAGGEMWTVGTHEVTGTFPALPHGGTYHWGLLITSAGPGDDEANNVLLGETIHVTQATELDIGAYVHGPAMASVGTLVSVSFAFDPIGDGPNDGRVVLLTEAQASGSKTLTLKNAPITLATGTYSGEPTQMKVMIPGTTPGGDYFYGLILEDPNPWSSTDRLVVGSPVTVVHAQLGG